MRLVVLLDTRNGLQQLGFWQPSDKKVRAECDSVLYYIPFPSQSYAATWCPVCDKRVSDKGKDTFELLAHIRKSHPKHSGQYLPQVRDSSSLFTRSKLSMESICNQHKFQPCRHRCLEEKESTTASKQITSKCSVRTSCNTGKSEPRKVYATRVDTWKSHNEKKVCPRCQNEAVPTLHARGDKLTTSHIGALCLLGCWPLCFVPLMMKRAKKVRMICPMCGYVYGSFQYKNTGLAPCNTDSEDSQARLSSPPRSFRVRTIKEED
ncbi:uncharacterized protein LOC143371100 [Andrena cerasifolii]|uniref:uncharacterized protein LOC143371100 n=1 Tax=Andrena cerasifolii TaxID=2819439 RepID=UPI0040379130